MSVPPPPFAAMPPHGLPDLIEHDACALAAFVTRDGKPDRRMVDHALVGLQMKFVSESAYALVIFMTGITTLVAPPVMKIVFRDDVPMEPAPVSCLHPTPMS